MESTLDVKTPPAEQGSLPEPGVLLVYAAAAPTLRAAPVADAGVDIGRDAGCTLQVTDTSLSRRHARIAWRDGAWEIEDLGSRNGTFVDGERISGKVVVRAARVVRAGLTVLLCSGDLRGYRDPRVAVRDGVIVGPRFAVALAEAEHAARFGTSLHVTGESGAGKEIVARAFHDAAGRRGPFVPVNCAAIPVGLAERLLFGVRRGAFSGADADADGYLQAADKGTLFLDELGELDLAVQAKLLRVLQTSEVLPLGGTKPQCIDIRLCSATLHSLRERVAAGRFREDLYYRVAKPEVAIAPLRDRLEELPWLTTQEAARVREGLRPDAMFIEAALLRPWPGNVRELLAETAAAARAAVIAGEPWVEARHLHAEAGRAIHVAADDADAASAAPADRPAQIAQALRREEGNVARAARALGVHRNQLRRWLARYAIDPRQFAPPGVRARDDDQGD